MRGGTYGPAGSEQTTMANMQRQPGSQPRAADGMHHEHAVPHTHVGRRLPARVSFQHLFVQIVALLISVLAIVGIGVSIYAYRQVDRTQQDAQRQVLQVSSTLKQTSITLNSVTTAAQQGAGTVDESSQALRDAAQTVRITADRLDDTAGRINFTIPVTNQRPLAGVDENFRAEATQLRQFAAEIDRTRTSLGGNASNLRLIGDQVSTVAKQTNDIGTITDTGDLATLARGFRLVLMWSVVVHIMLLLICISLIVLTTDHWTLAHIFRRHDERGHARFEPSRSAAGERDD
jgi:hypothetical protein